MDRRILVIDDIRTFEGAKHARTAEQGIRALEKFDFYKWDEVWLDHDLGYNRETGKEMTIRPVVEWLEQNILPVTLYLITANPYGMTYIRQALFGKYTIHLRPCAQGLHLKRLEDRFTVFERDLKPITDLQSYGLVSWDKHLMEGLG